MQLIFETEHTLHNTIDNMSALENTLSEKVITNGVIEDPNRNCNDNKENLGEGNITKADEVVQVNSSASTLTKTAVSDEEALLENKKGRVEVVNGEENNKGPEDYSKINDKEEILANNCGDASCPDNNLQKLPEDCFENNISESSINTQILNVNWENSIENNINNLKKSNDMQVEITEPTDKNAENENNMCNEETIESIANFIARETEVESAHNHIKTKPSDNRNEEFHRNESNKTQDGSVLNKTAVDAISENAMEAVNDSNVILDSGHEQPAASIKVRNKMNIEEIEKVVPGDEGHKVVSHNEKMDAAKSIVINEKCNATSMDGLVEEPLINITSTTELSKVDDTEAILVNNEIEELKEALEGTKKMTSDMNNDSTVFKYTETCVTDEKEANVSYDEKFDDVKEVIELKDEVLSETKEDSNNKIEVSNLPAAIKNSVEEETRIGSNKEMDIEEVKVSCDSNTETIKVPLAPEETVKAEPPVDLKEEIDIEEIKYIPGTTIEAKTCSSEPSLPKNKVVEGTIIDLNEEVDLEEIKYIPDDQVIRVPLKSALPENNVVTEPPIDLNDVMDVEEIKDDPETKIEAINPPLASALTDNKVAVESTIDLNEAIDIEEIKDVPEKTKSIEDPVAPSQVDKAVVEEPPIDLNDDIDVEEVNDIPTSKTTDVPPVAALPVKTVSETSLVCKLSNTLDILSDDDEEPQQKESQSQVDQSKQMETKDKQCINIEDDDDIMVIDEDIPSKPDIKEIENNEKEQPQPPPKPEANTDLEIGEDCKKLGDDLINNSNEKESPQQKINVVHTSADIDINEKLIPTEPLIQEPAKPLLPETFLKSAKKNLADMTREDLEEFCILKIVESVVDRGSLSDIKNKLKNMAQSLDEYRKKAMMLTKQNRDLQVVLKSVQEEQKKVANVPVTPLRITRSVGMQVLMADKTNTRRKGMATPGQNANANSPNKPMAKNQIGASPRMQKANNQNIPVPRLVPANTPAMKSPSTVPNVQANIPGKNVSPVLNGMRPGTPVQKVAEKRQHSRIQSFTVDLTDDEPPSKISPRISPAPPVRLVPPQNLMAPQRPQTNTPRKVYIPISGPQNQNIRAGQTIMLKPVTSSVSGIRPRCVPPQISRPSTPATRRLSNARHPAPLPDSMKQYQPPNWKALPPAPDLRLSKVENGIVISWKIEGYQEDSYEEIASYQLYAYQETSSPPSTNLWKKIGDVKALPLPMACTLTQFMAGFKYYFAVRAIDVKSRFGPFSLPGSILLLNKL